MLWHSPVSALSRHVLLTMALTGVIVCGYSASLSENEEMMAAAQPGTYVLFFALSIGDLTGNISDGSQGNTTVPVLVHRKSASKSCELVQNGSLVIAKQFAWVEIEGEKSETYSPEMGPGDYLSSSPPLSGRAAKDARKSGFALKGGSTIATDAPKVVALVSDADCPNLQGAISEVEQARALRRAAVQARAYMPDTDGVIMPSPLKDESAPRTGQGTPANNPAKEAAPKGKLKYQGTVVLNILISMDGTVQRTMIVQSVNAELDKKAVEEVSHWKFTPGRKKGLPVPILTHVEVSFNLY